jgi:hypothetical protein
MREVPENAWDLTAADIDNFNEGPIAEFDTEEEAVKELKSNPDYEAFFSKYHNAYTFYYCVTYYVAEMEYNDDEDPDYWEEGDGCEINQFTIDEE